VILPVEVVFHPSWWHKHAGISFDPDFYYHPGRRVEDERRMEEILFQKFGDLGLGEDHGRDVPWVGNVHNAAGFLLSEMLGCRVEYPEDGPPLVIPAERPDLDFDVEAAFAGPAYRRFVKLVEALQNRFGYVRGDANWGGLLNLALDLRGQAIFLDMVDRPDETIEYFARIGRVIDRFTAYLQAETGTTSISVNRTVRHLADPVFLHSECALTMISTDHYRRFIKPVDAAWSMRRRPFGIHYCGADPQRFFGEFASLPSLDFLDVGWGGDLQALRESLPRTFLNIRLSPVEIVGWDEAGIRREIETRVEASGDPRLTGVCCINLDDRVSDVQVRAIFATVFDLRRRFSASSRS
jgi:hypothetical protein